MLSLRVLLIFFASIFGGVSAQDSDGSDLNCPVGTAPITDEACGAVPDEGICKYNFVTCLGGASTFLNVCFCSGDKFSCLTAQPCPAFVTEFPSSAPSQAPQVDPPAESWTYELPSWWDTVQQSNGSRDLKRCFKRQFPPVQGSTCATRRKVCYFSKQECTDIGAFPTTKCTCNGSQNTPGSWSCEVESCPIAI